MSKLEEIIKTKNVNMKDILLPDYNNSILNTITSILKYYNVETHYNSLKELDEKLEKKHKNVVVIILDGMGKYVLDEISKDGYFSNNILKNVTSVYPSTTTAALTTYYSGKPPYESAWIAWSQYFKEYGRNIDMLKHTDSYSGEIYTNVKKDVFKEVVNYESIFEKIEKKGTKAYEIVPKYSDKRSKRTLVADSIDEMIDGIKLLCNQKEEKFVMAYCDNPDGILHKYGTDSVQAKDFVKEAEIKIENMIQEIDEDTIFIISADHGHKNIHEEYTILDYPELEDDLILTPSLESRCVTFWVKEDRKEHFKNTFNSIFDKEFILLTKDEFINSNLIGYGEKHKKIDDFIGDFVAISISNSIIKIENYLFDGKKRKKSTHCGLAKEEMLVPVIVIEK